MEQKSSEKQLFMIDHLGPINKDNIIVASIAAIKVAEKFTDISGVQRRSLVIDAINKLISLTPEPERIILQTLSNEFLPTIIDSLVYMGNLEFKKMTKNCCFRKAV
jgi:hypothetical protein